MLTINRILCPVDLTPESSDALRYALAPARVYESKLYLCHVAADVAPFGGAGMVTGRIRSLFAGMIAKRLSYGDLGRIDWEGVVVGGGGDTSGAITREAAERGYDLLVLRQSPWPVPVASPLKPAAFEPELPAAAGARKNGGV